MIVELVVAVAIGTTPALAQAPNLRSVVEDATPYVVTLRVYDANGSEISQGSAFFVEDGRIITNHHVVEGGDRVEVINRDGQLLGVIAHAEVMSVRTDLALLPKLAGHGLGLPLATALPSAGDGVIVISSPEGLGNSVSEGIVSAVRDVDGVTLLQITAPVSSGSSGGPVLDSTGRVVGVTVSTLEDGQNLNFAIPSSNVRALMASPAGEYSFGGSSDPIRFESGAPNEADLAVIVLGQTARGELDEGDLQADDGRRSDFYYFDAQAGDAIRIYMRSTAFDTYLILSLFADDEVSLVAEDDDDGGGTDSLIVAELPATGTYVIAAAGFDETETGPYTLLAEPTTISDARDSPNESPSVVDGPVGYDVLVSEDPAGVVNADSLKAQLEGSLFLMSFSRDGLLEQDSDSGSLIYFYAYPTCLDAAELTSGSFAGGFCAVGIEVLGQGASQMPTLEEQAGTTGDTTFHVVYSTVFVVSGDDAPSIQRLIIQQVTETLEELPWTEFVVSYREWLRSEIARRH